MRSKEPWVFKIDKNYCPEILSADKETVIPALRFADEDLKRIVLCVNACINMPNEMLEEVISGDRIIVTEIA